MVRRDILNEWDVLVVDDDPLSAEIAARILRHYGATVYTAQDGLDALKQLEGVRPAFIVSDISMPEMDGWGFIEAIKADYRLQNIPVIALTAHGNQEADRKRAFAAGFHNYLTKPLVASTFIKDLLVLLVDVPHFDLDLE